MAIKKRSMGEGIFDLCNVTLMFVFSLIILYPFWNMLLISLSSAAELNKLGFKIWIDEWSLSAYAYIFERGKIYVAYMNTLFRTIVGTVLSVVMGLLAAYPLSKRNLPGKNIITAFFVITMFFSGGIIPTFLLIRSLGLINNLLVLVIPGMFSVFDMIIVRNYLMTMGQELEESALIDGANYLHILFRIMVPLSMPVIATVALWAAVGHWNAWFDARMYLSGNRFVLLQTMIQELIENSSTEAMDINDFVLRRSEPINTQNVIAATTIVTIGPIVLLYPFLQKYFVKGIMVGSLKG